ncbi:MAG TPA: YicC/YloC family endoribonuclease [Gemmatimonadales bacterium]|nr:YicC/YloC family endoribonuclease [Gemmatimonadales bacterium]
MTGFGAAEGPAGRGQLRVEIRTVNHRFFNPAFKLPGELAALEGEVRDRLKREFERGHIAVSVRWADNGSRGGTLQLNVDRAREAMARLRELQTAVGLTGEISLELLSRQMDVLSVDEPETAPIPWAEVEPIVARAAAECRAMRRREGQSLAAELEHRVEAIAQLAAQVEAHAPERLVRERDRLRAAIAQLLDGRAADETRLAQELALYADRLDITEELVRLRAHLVATREALRVEQAVGKQLGFLAQEIGREVNTIGSKANDATIGQLAIAMKGELEKFREQVENLE